MLASLLLAAVLGPIAAPARAAAAEGLDRIRELSDHWASGMLSPEEKDELLRDLTRQVLSAGEQSAAQPQAPVAAGGKGVKVIAAYHDRNTSKFVLESHGPLVAGSPVYAGPQEQELILLDLLSRSKDLYYYAASAPGHVPVHVGDPVVNAKARVLETPSPLQLKIQETYTFESKRLGEVTAVQDGRAMIDRGTLHEVRERDIYRVLDASGVRKGFLEIRGIGDLQSSGVLYNRLGDRSRRALETAPGDRVEFMGQRKLFGLGGIVGLSLSSHEEYGKTENGRGAGVVWDLMFKDGWGFEALFGNFERRLHNTQTLIVDRGGGGQAIFQQEIDWKADYFFPIALKKNFFFPSVASPFLLAGGGVFKATAVKHELVSDPPTNSFKTFEGTAQGVMPMLGVGVEAFPARLIRPRADVRWFGGPTLVVGDKSFRTQTIVVSVGIFSAW